MARLSTPEHRPEYRPCGHWPIPAAPGRIWNQARDSDTEDSINPPPHGLKSWEHFTAPENLLGDAAGSGEHPIAGEIPADQFEHLALEQIETLRRVAWRLVPDSSAAEDLVQETYLRAFGARDGFMLHAHGIRPWLLRIMYNLYFSRTARHGWQPTMLDRHEDEAVDRATVGTLPIDSGSFDAMDQRLVAALYELPTEYSSVFMLWAIQDMSYKEIAGALDIPVGTVMSRMHRARRRLADKLHDLAIDQRLIRK